MQLAPIHLPLFNSTFHSRFNGFLDLVLLLLGVTTHPVDATGKGVDNRQEVINQFLLRVQLLVLGSGNHDLTAMGLSQVNYKVKPETTQTVLVGHNHILQNGLF